MLVHSVFLYKNCAKEMYNNKRNKHLNELFVNIKKKIFGILGEKFVKINISSLV